VLRVVKSVVDVLRVVLDIHAGAGSSASC